MSALYCYRIVELERITQPSSHGEKFQLKAEIILTDKLGTLQEQSNISEVAGTVEFATYPLYGWPQLYTIQSSNKVINLYNLTKIAYEFGRINLEEKLKDGEINEGTFVIKLSHDSSPKACPFDPDHVVMDFEK